MKMNDNAVSGRTYNLLKKGIETANIRKRVISNNIANVNTKGYKKFDVVFEENLKSQSNGNMKITNEKHLTPNGNAGEIKVVRDESSSMRSDGNNVDIDSEMTNLAANTLMYNALISEMNSRFNMTRNVIRGGK